MTKKVWRKPELKVIEAGAAEKVAGKVDSNGSMS